MTFALAWGKAVGLLEKPLGKQQQMFAEKKTGAVVGIVRMVCPYLDTMRGALWRGLYSTPSDQILGLASFEAFLRPFRWPGLRFQVFRDTLTQYREAVASGLTEAL